MFNIMNSDKYLCKSCKLNFNEMFRLAKHNWLEHPSNVYEKKWSELYKSGQLFSGKYTMAYQDDPYY